MILCEAHGNVLPQVGTYPVCWSKLGQALESMV